MSKKKQRISYLVGIRNAINECEVLPEEPEKCTYDKTKMQSVLATVDRLLSEDGVFPMNADSKVNED